MNELRPAFDHAICDELNAALSRISHCVSQLSDEQVWWRPRPDMNSIGNLLLHLAGNVRQLIVSGVGGEPDDRDRPAEFAVRTPVSASELIGKLTIAVKRACDAVMAASPETLCAPLKVKRYDWNGIQGIVRCVAHFRGHTQEIIHITRTILGEKYQYAGPK